ncbi:MAG: phosphatase PAP2-related protein, partial [bacterium]|nr:phosphatase PAP2-related protein [bacterium]
MINTIFARHKDFWSKETLLLWSGGIVLFVLAIIFQRFAYIYVDTYITGVHVGDLLLDNLPAVNLDFFIVQGALVSTALVLIFLLLHPSYFPFATKTLALFIFVRSFFISLTHLGVNLHQITLNTNSLGFGIYEFLYFGKNDFFFSGHVGAAFLLALIFWEKKPWRYLFLAIAVIFAVSMLLAKMHYSIDVFA